MFRPSNQISDNHNSFTISIFIISLGSIAEREYQKWYNAVEMPNNPYSAEALQRRLSGSQEKCIDIPIISSSTQPNPIELAATSSDLSDSNDNLLQERDYLR